MNHLSNCKLISVEEADVERKKIRREGKAIVLTNGCFDLLHAGHVYSLQEASQLGDELWILLNSDESVHGLKGASRPIVPEQERAFCLAGLSCVSRVVIFNTKRITKEIRILEPDVYVKAGDYTLDTLHGEERDALDKIGTRIQFLPYAEGISATRLIEKIRTMDPA